eukprot:CAMPEP_0172444802 /NCGR_PEP_ID=MMETSP1065-20121228/4809_1 /TAXON_ID=265537 /ORGANISM="Amphiprora paludosa, Strain CCMP125" /LENGTH=572 /DNA_ID=CAMNT_0013195501 /DNA_START=185 /DNA_END=1903 /DNA_ORIENTATION=+
MPRPQRTSMLSRSENFASDDEAPMSRSGLMVKQQSAPIASLSTSDHGAQYSRGGSANNLMEASQKKIVMKAVGPKRTRSGDGNTLSAVFSQSVPNMEYNPDRIDDSSFDHSESSWSAMHGAESGNQANAGAKVAAGARKPNMVRQVRPSHKGVAAAPSTPGKRIKKKTIRASDLEKIGIKIDKNTTAEELEDAIRKWKIEQKKAELKSSSHSKKSHESDYEFKPDKPNTPQQPQQPETSKPRRKSLNTTVESPDFTGLVIGGGKTEISSPGRERPPPETEESERSRERYNSRKNARSRSRDDRAPPNEDGENAAVNTRIPNAHPPIPDWEYLNHVNGGAGKGNGATGPPDPDTDSPRSKVMTTAQLRADAAKAIERGRSNSPSSRSVTSMENSANNVINNIRARRRSKSPATGLLNKSRSRTPSRRGSHAGSGHRTPSRRGSKTGSGHRTPSRRGSNDGERTPGGRGRHGLSSSSGHKRGSVSASAKGRDLSKSPAQGDYKPVSWRVEDASLHQIPSLDDGKQEGRRSRRGSRSAATSLDDHDEIQVRLREAGITKDQYRSILAAGLKVSLA